MTNRARKDFTKGSVFSNIVRLAVPMTMAQLIHLLYNIVDRIYIGHIPEHATASLTGLGVCFPIITMILAFANLVGMGGAPLFSMERGAGNEEEAERILGNSFTMLLFLGILLTVIGFLFKTPLLWLLGASGDTIEYAEAYLSVYLIGTTFVMVSLGLNSFIDAQGFGGMGMLTVAIGAVLNMILDPIFIFQFGMGVKGAAVATVISQFVSSLWTLYFLTGKRTIIKLKKTAMKPEAVRIKKITGLGLSGFTASFTNSLVQMVNNVSLGNWGGDIYITVITVINSVREVIELPAGGIAHGARPIMSFNFGAGEYERVKKAIRNLTVMLLGYTVVAWVFISFFPEFWISIFNRDSQVLQAGVPSLHIYFLGFIMMTFQYAGQTVFQALGYAKHAMFFSIFRKVIIVVPLILLLPALGFGVNGVFMAEPISNLIGGIASFTTMLVVIYRKLGKENLHK